MDRFVLKAPYQASGDQPEAIEALAEGVRKGLKDQILLGVTGSGKTFTMASVIEKVQKPTLVIAHNKTLAGQLCSELKAFFPDSRVEYFVSYYDYYQPEAYIASSDTYIEKDASINDEIDRLRHSATAALRERKDVIIVASVSCIYSMGDPSEYEGQMLSLRPGMRMERSRLLRALIDIQYERNDVEFARGTFRVKGDTVEVIPAGEHEKAIRIEMFGDEIDRICQIEAVSGHVLATLEHAALFPATHYATDPAHMEEHIAVIEADLAKRIQEFEEQGRLLEAQRIAQRTRYDIEMMREIGYCQGIENYSRYFDGRKPGDAPYTLLDYFKDDFLVLIDESHVTIPQIRAMYNGDRARKETLVDYGFRLPSAFDNRPLLFHEFEERIGQTIYVSATPGPYERERAQQVVEQIIRPTGLLDPKVILRPATGQIDDLVGRDPAGNRRRAAGAGDHADQAHGGKPDGISEGTGNQGEISAQRHPDHRADGAAAGSAAGRVRRAGGHQPAAGGTGPAGGGAGGDPGRGQGRLPAQRDLADPDDRPRRPERGGTGDSLRRHADGEHGEGHDRNEPPPGAAGGL